MRLRFALFILAAIPTLLLATPPDEVKPAAPEPDLPDGTAAGLRNMAGFRLPPGMKVELFAAEPMLASPVAISVDEKGRVYVAEEYRLGQGAAENRDNPAFKYSFFLEDDLQIRTTADRLAVYRKWQNKLPGGMAYFTSHSDQIRRIEDTKGVGKADRSMVFARGFNNPLDGLGAGVLARDGDVYYTNIPNLWRFKDTKSNPLPSPAEAILTGFGPNIAFFGHDLHGLIFGPDGKLYFSVGDRGFHVETREGTTLSGPRTGAVFRCDPDGANLEVVMRGLRNPQELAFDQFGNLFADDNNCDKGDFGRLVYVVEEGDCGWNMAYQTIPAPYIAGPWFAERMWHLPHPGQPAWIVPPVGKVGTGPAGFLFTSGTTLPDRYRNSFIMCNYAGGRGLEAFKLKPKGAGFEIDDYHDFLVPVMATDAEFGPDGKLYISDFVNLDWNGKSLGGRIYTAFDPAKVNSAAAIEVKKLYADGFAVQTTERLVGLLAHGDQKVRLRAQWALASRGAKEALAEVAAKSGNQLARLHAIWGLGQIGRKDRTALAPVVALFKDADPEVVAQAARVIGDDRQAGGKQFTNGVELIGLLKSPEPRVRFFAAQGLGKLGHREAVPFLFQVIAHNNDADPFLRHACVVALARIADPAAVNAMAHDTNPAVRMAVILVQRRLADRRVGKLLGDSDPLIRAEAARAVHDLPLTDRYADLASLLPRLTAATDDDATARRALDAAFYLGTADYAQLVFDAACNPALSMAVRAEAVAALRDWTNPPQRDRVTGSWRTLAKRDPAVVRGVVSPGFEKLLGSATGSLLVDVVGLIGPLGLDVSESVLGAWVGDIAKAVPVRVSALRVLADRKAKTLPEAIAVVLKASSPLLRAEARDAFASTDPARGVDLYAKVLGDETAAAIERQRAVAGLTTLKVPAAGTLLDAWAARLAAGQVPAELRLDIQEALKGSPNANRDRLRMKFEAGLPTGPHGKFAISLTGGDADRGRDIFFGNAAVQCARCHVVNGSGGNAGPDLTKVAARYPDKTREFLLESLLTPSARIAPGYGTVTLNLADGRTVTGTLTAEDAKQLTLRTPNDKTEVIPLDEVERRSTPTSPMPAVDKTLTPREVRDLIEYLNSLR